MNTDMPALAAGSCYESRLTRALCSGPKTSPQIAAAAQLGAMHVPSVVSRANQLLAVPGWQITKTKGIYSISRRD